MNNTDSFKTILDFLERSAKRSSQKTALIFEENEYSYGQVDKGASEIASILMSQTEKGDVVALMLPNSPEFIFSYFGIFKAGCIVLLLSHNISDDNLVFQVETTRPKCIVSQTTLLSKLERTGILERAKYIDVHNLPQKEDFSKKRRKISEEDVSTIIFTSGTTSEPKGVKLQHKNVVAASKNIIEFLGWNENDIDMNASQLSHSFGLGNVHCVFAVGGTSILFRDAINLKKIIQTIIDKKATAFSTVPTILKLILDNFREEFSKCDPFLRFIQTNMSSLDPEFIKSMLDTLPTTDFNYYYGLSEASRATFINFNNHLDKIGSVGRSSPNVKVKIVDENGKELGSGEAGEICIGGDLVIKEYWENPEASKKIKDGWLFTNDYGYLDEDGFLYFKGRKDDIINVSGEKVSPEEIEEVIKLISGIIDAGVVGVADKLLGEVVKAFIVVQEDNFDTNKVIEECQKKLERYKVPKYVEIINEIPRTSNGKLKRNSLKKL